MKKILLFLSALLVLCESGLAHADDYVIDNDHSEIGFSVKHMVITNVRGAFKDYSGSFSVDDHNSLTSISAEIITKSIDTRIKKRDDHLRSADFFEITRFPTISYTSSSITSTGKNSYAVKGYLTIKNISKPVLLNGELTAPVKDPWGNQRIGIILRGQIDRNNYGLTYNKVLESGGLLIGDEVLIHLEGQGILKK